MLMLMQYEIHCFIIIIAVILLSNYIILCEDCECSTIETNEEDCRNCGDDCRYFKSITE